MDKQHVREEEQKETLGKIITELRAPYAWREWKKALRENYKNRWPTYYKNLQQIKTTELPEKEKKWRNDLVTILTNFDVFDTYVEEGEVDLNQFSDFIKDVEENNSYLFESTTLRKLFNDYKKKFKEYTSEKTNKKIKKRKRKRTDSSEE